MNGWRVSHGSVKRWPTGSFPEAVGRATHQLRGESFHFSRGDLVKTLRAETQFVFRA